MLEAKKQFSIVNLKSKLFNFFSFVTNLPVRNSFQEKKNGKKNSWFLLNMLEVLRKAKRNKRCTKHSKTSFFFAFLFQQNKTDQTLTKLVEKKTHLGASKRLIPFRSKKLFKGQVFFFRSFILFLG
jgi:hypothetical protein